MSEPEKKKLTKIWLVILAVLCVINSVALGVLWYFFANQPAEDANMECLTYYEIGDVAYIRTDVAKIDPQKVEQGDVNVYNITDIQAKLDEARAKRDANRETSGAAN